MPQGSMRTTPNEGASLIRNRASLQAPTVELCPRLYGGPGGVAVFHERSTPVDGYGKSLCETTLCPAIAGSYRSQRSYSKGPTEQNHGDFNRMDGPRADHAVILGLKPLSDVQKMTTGAELEPLGC